jgi:predicted small secreted protein
MKKSAMIFILTGIIAFSLSSCATTGAGDAAKKTDAVKTMKTTLGPSKLYEHCMEISPGQKMNYTFSSEDPLNFYIHYHQEGSRYEEDKRDEVTAHEGTFSPDKKQVYCLTWTNPQSRSVDITYSFVIQ